MPKKAGYHSVFCLFCSESKHSEPLHFALGKCQERAQLPYKKFLLEARVWVQNPLRKAMVPVLSSGLYGSSPANCLQFAGTRARTAWKIFGVCARLGSESLTRLNTIAKRWCLFWVFQIKKRGSSPCILNGEFSGTRFRQRTCFLCRLVL